MPVYGSILYHYWNFNVECWRNFEIGVMGRSKSLEMAPFDRSIAYQFIFHCNYGRRILYRFRNNGRYWSKTTFFHTPVPKKRLPGYILAGSRLQPLHQSHPKLAQSCLWQHNLCVSNFVAVSYTVKVTQGHLKWHTWVWGPVYVFHCNFVCISYRFWDIQRQRVAYNKRTVMALRTI